MPAGADTAEVPTTRLRAAAAPTWAVGIGSTMIAGAIVVMAYVVAAEIGFRVAFVAQQVTTVWAPTGIALATLLLCGRSLWPAVWLGAFLVNAGDAPALAAVFIATGNTLEAVAGSWALRRLGFDVAFRRVRDILAFAGIAVILSTTVSATIGVVTLCAAGVQPWVRFSAMWFDWWFGDALGALIVAPAILTVVRPRARTRRQWTSTTLFVGGTTVVTHFTFSRVLGPSTHPLEYVVFPAVMAAAVYEGPAATSLAVLSASAVAIWNTVQGAGPFAGPEVHHSLILLQTFMGVLGGTALLLAAAVAERETSEHREKEAARVLRQREEMLQIAQRAGGVATFEWDFKSQRALCSAEFFRIFGLPRREGSMEASEWARFVHPADRDRMTAHLARAIDGTEAAIADYRIVRADGTVRWLSYAGHLQTTDDDRACMFGTVLDITDRKRTELALHEAKNAAESANRLKDQFLATLSHELRTPLNAILGYTRMLQTDAIAPDRRQHAIDVIERNAAAQHQLVEDLLDMSRITTGTVRLDPEPIPLAQLVLEAVEGIRPAAEAKRLVLDLDLDPFAGMVLGDRSRLQQVFWNLLTNAIKFTDADGRITAAVRRDGSHVEVSVRDTGVGIPPDFLPFVFDPFRQGEGGLARSHGGLGLGLAISRQLVELHGGTIAAVSDGPGRGATFIVCLPWRNDTSPARPTRRRSSAGPPDLQTN